MAVGCALFASTEGARTHPARAVGSRIALSTLETLSRFVSVVSLDALDKLHLPKSCYFEKKPQDTMILMLQRRFMDQEAPLLSIQLTETNFLNTRH